MLSSKLVDLDLQIATIYWIVLKNIKEPPCPP